MNTTKLKNATLEELLNIWAFLNLLEETNEKYNFLCYCEKRQLEIQRKQLKHLFENR